MSSLKSYEAALKRISSQGVDSLYLAFGSDGFLKHRLILTLLKKLGLRRQSPDVTFIEDSGKLETLLRLLEFPPFGATKRLIVLEVEELVPQALERVASAVQEFSCVVLMLNQPSAPRISEHGVVLVPCQTPAGDELVQWILLRAKAKKMAMDYRAAWVLASSGLQDLWAVECELEKLLCYSAPAHEVSLDMVKEVTATVSPVSVFEFADYWSKGQKGEALVALHHMLSKGESPVSIVGILARQLRLIWETKALIERGTAQSRIASLLSVPSFLAAKYTRLAARLSYDQLRHAVSVLRDCDLDIKTGRVNPQLALEEFVLLTL